MGVADVDHGAEDSLPGARRFKHGIGEHTSVPTDVLDTTAGGVLEPVAGSFDDVELAAWIISQAVFASFVVSTSTLDSTVVLSDMEVDSPRPKGVGHLFVGSPELIFAVAIINQGVLRRIVAEGVEVGMSKVALEAKRPWHTDALKDVKHVFPRMHTSPADFSFGSETFTVISGDRGGLREGVDDTRCAGHGIFTPFSDAVLGRVDADAAILAHAVLVEDSGDTTGHFHGAEEFFLLGVITHSGAAVGTWPHWGDKGTDGESFAGDEIGDLLQFVIAGLRIGMRQEEKVVDAIELLSVNVGGGSEVEHTLE